MVLSKIQVKTVRIGIFFEKYPILRDFTCILLRAWEIETHDSVVGLAEDFGREAAENF